ncbi:MAG: hypothetical protein GY850_15230 [bacterium]|nr:hypothetical protein [bacterium]
MPDFEGSEVQDSKVLDSNLAHLWCEENNELFSPEADKNELLLTLNDER